MILLSVTTHDLGRASSTALVVAYVYGRLFPSSLPPKLDYLL